MKLNQELIEKIRKGTHCIKIPNNPTHQDFEIMQMIRDEYFCNDNSYIQNMCTHYKIVSRQKQNSGRFAFWSFPMNDKYFNDMVPIPLSEFSSEFKNKMIDVEELKEWVELNTIHKAQDGYILTDELLNLFNEKGI